MQTEIAETIFEKVKGLSAAEQREVLKIIEDRVSAQVDKNMRPIWEVLTEMSAEIPEEMWAELPTDGSINHDHYLYGAPKKNL
ncbi:MAG: hypothetical protein QM785_05035 [Pyrinomonadaceae bacterium]